MLSKIKVQFLLQTPLQVGIPGRNGDTMTPSTPQTPFFFLLCLLKAASRHNRIIVMPAIMSNNRQKEAENEKAEGGPAA